MSARRPFANALDFMGSVHASFEYDRDESREDERGIMIRFSVGQGRGASRHEMNDSEFIDFAYFICGDASVEIAVHQVRGDRLSPAQIAARTFAWSEEDGYSWKVSQASGARTAKVPRGNMVAFRDFLQNALHNLNDWRDDFWPAKEGNPEANTEE